MVRHYLHQNRLPRFLLHSNITVRENNQTTSSIPENGDSNLDGNMVIILAALLCAIICGLGLSSIVRFALRFSRRIASASAEERFDIGSTGLKKDVLRGIPIVIYKSAASGENNTWAATDCAICLAEFKEGERVRILPKCDHWFHVKCVDKWLGSNSSCPTCRQLLFQPLPTTDTGQAV